MPATVIAGLFGTDQLAWVPQAVGQPAVGITLVPNNQPVSVTLTGAVVSGAQAADFTVDPGQFPVVVNPGQTAIIEVTATPSALGARNALLTITTNRTGFVPSFPLITSGNNTVPDARLFPSNTLYFPTTKVGSVSDFVQARIVNLWNADVTVTSIAITTGVNFSIVSAPATPFLLPRGTVSALITIEFAPTVVGSLNDAISVTVNGVNTTGSALQGTGSVLTSAFPLSGGTTGALFAFPGVAFPMIRLANIDDLSTEEASSIFRMHDFQQPNLESQLLRVRGHYEDLGVAAITITAETRRKGKPNSIVSDAISIGTIAADGWVREFIGDLNISGELIRITVGRAANSGPVSIIDYCPMLEPKGEVIEGT